MTADKLKDLYPVKAAPPVVATAHYAAPDEAARPPWHGAIAAHPLTRLYRDIKDFREATGLPATTTPRPLTPPEARARAAMIGEEVTEVAEATTITTQLWELIDVLYITIDAMTVIGIDPAPIWEAIHRANMSKIWEDGKARISPAGKLIKPPSYQSPEEEINNYVARMTNI